MKKDGLSTYTINGTKATKGDVVTALKKKGIDLDHNRFLILQGEVEQISLMKPKVYFIFFLTYFLYVFDLPFVVSLQGLS